MPRWQTVAKWAAGASLAALGVGLAAYACRNDWFLSDLPCADQQRNDTDEVVSDIENSIPNPIPCFDLGINDTAVCEEVELMQTPCFDLGLNDTAVCEEVELMRTPCFDLGINNTAVCEEVELMQTPSFAPGLNDTAVCEEVELMRTPSFALGLNGTAVCEEVELMRTPSFALGLNGTVPCEQIELMQTPFLDPGLNGTVPCEETALEQEWLVCEKASELGGLKECEILKNVCISSEEKPKSFLASAGSVALKCAAQAGSRVCSSTINVGKTALRTLGRASYQTGRMCMKGLLAAKVSHHTLGTCDPNPALVMALSRTPLRCLTHDLAPFLRHHGMPLR